MKNTKSYAGLDYFRFIAAILVIAIHTSPLLSFSETGDLLLTRGLARTAVPFFFMTSGFFLISRYGKDAEGLNAFLGHTARLYGIAMLLCLPVNIYSGYFRSQPLMPKLIQDIVFDGTLYHLWYLPASITGAFLTWHFVRKLDYAKAFPIVLALYGLGLAGDSYYGIAERLPLLHSFYGLLFQITDHTRNGIFFAPLFFFMGGWIADTEKRLSFQTAAAGFTVSLCLLFSEVLLVHRCGLPRFDSMYLSLPVCMFFLFQGLLSIPGKRTRFLRTASLFMYLLHPLLIIAVRLLARLLHLEGLLIENSLLHFLAVCLASTALSFGIAALEKRAGLSAQKRSTDTDRCWIEVNADHLKHNVTVLKQALPPDCALMAVVKADAYGHSAFAISACLDRMGVTAFAAATIDEAIALRRYGIRGEILILGYTPVLRARELKKYDLIQTVLDFDYAKALQQQKTPVKVHIKIDTGMHRLGISADDADNVKSIFAMQYLHVCGIYTHLCCADSLLPDDTAFTETQIRRFYQLLHQLERDGIALPKVHIQSSYGLLNYPWLTCDYARIGIALYGVLSGPGEETVLKLPLRPVLSLKARIALIRTVPAGESIGYGRAFTAKRDSLIAILAIGYGDGLPRALSCGKGFALLHGRRVPILGRVCMDQLAIDITDLEYDAAGAVDAYTGANHASVGAADAYAETADAFAGANHAFAGAADAGAETVDAYTGTNHAFAGASASSAAASGQRVSVGDTVTLIGTDGDASLPAPAVADWAGSISNELLCRLGKRLPVIVKNA